MKILFVAMAESVHTARWISQVHGQGWDIHLFPSKDQNTVSPDLKQVTLHHTIYTVTRHADPSIQHRGIRLWSPVQGALFGRALRFALKKLRPDYRINRLVNLIKDLKPDIIHSLEFQHSAYMVLEARRRLGEDFPFPTWIASSWGNDIYLFGRTQAHQQPLKDVLEAIDYYIADCKRDIPLAQQHGLTGQVLGALPGGGGYDLTRLPPPESLTPPSQRKVILLKGYQTFAGRSLFALRALALCKDVLQDYEIVIYFAMPDVELAAELVAHETGLNIRIFQSAPHAQWLELLATARINIGVSISDGTPLAMLESLLVGTFPIQSFTACVDEWVDDGVTGLIVPPEDPKAIAEAIRKAVTDDALVDNAARLNMKMTAENIAYEHIQAQALKWYRDVALSGK